MRNQPIASTTFHDSRAAADSVYVYIPQESPVIALDGQSSVLGATAAGIYKIKVQ